ncbi:MAG: chromate transporter [Tissierellia bacterium]|nr:chromate transporter [Tissierellia bacterium]
MILLSLFIAFAIIGTISFGGGYAVLPFIEEMIVQRHGWLTSGEVIDIVTISQMTPGPIAINSATFVGTKVAGLPGSIVATVGNVLPQFIIMILLAQFVFRDKKISFMENIIAGLKPGMVGLIFIATLRMVDSSIFNGALGVDMFKNITSIFKNLDYLAIVTFIVGFILYLKKVDLIKIILVSAAIGFAYTLLPI